MQRRPRPFASASIIALLAFPLLGADAPAKGDSPKPDSPKAEGQKPATPRQQATKLDASKQGAANVGEKVQWLAFDAAVAKAEKENKHMIVDIYTNWCGWCKVMDRQTYGNPEVAAFLTSNFALAKVNGESSAKLTWRGKSITEREFARAVGVSGYPSTYFMKPNAELLGGVSGYIKSPDMMIYAKYISTKFYEKGKLQQFADSLRKMGS